MDTLVISLIFVTSYVGFVWTNQNAYKCGHYQSSPRSGFALKSGEIYIFSQTNIGPCLSVLRVMDNGNNATHFAVVNGYPKTVTDWTEQDFPTYYARDILSNVEHENLNCPRAVLLFPKLAGLLKYMSYKYKKTRRIRQWLKWYKIRTNDTQITFEYDEHLPENGLESYFLVKLGSESLVNVLNTSTVHSIIRIYSNNSDLLFNLAYIYDHHGGKRKLSYYFKYDLAESALRFLQNVNHSLHEYETGQFVAYDIPERNASFGYKFINSYSIPTIYYANMTEISIIDENGSFNQEFRQHVTKQAQLFIVSSDIWLGCPPFRDCLHLPVDALSRNLKGQPLIFSGKYINAKGTECEIGKKITSLFPMAPNYIDAAFIDDSQNYFLFKDGKLFQYNSSYLGMRIIQTHKVQEVFHNLPSVTAALYTKRFAYIFTDISNEKESEVWQYEWKNQGTKVHAKLLRIVKISFIHAEMSAAIDAATVLKNEIIIVKDSFYLAIKNMGGFYQRTLKHGTFELLPGSPKLGCYEAQFSSFKKTFLEEYFATQRPTAYNKNDGTSSRTMTFQTRKYIKPLEISILDYLMLISIPVLILTIACSLYWAIKKE